MPVSWRDLAFVPDESLTGDINAAWQWLLGPRDWTAVLCTRLGDFFIERANGEIHWLNCSAGCCDLAARDRATFDQICLTGGRQTAEWFGHTLVQRLHDAGKVAGNTQCYAFVVLPIFTECRFEPENLFVAPIREVFVGLAEVHRQIASLPDGQKVQLKVID